MHFNGPAFIREAAAWSLRRVGPQRWNQVLGFAFPVFSQQQTWYGPGRRWRNWRRSYPPRILSRDIKSSSLIGNRLTLQFGKEWGRHRC